jgi:hypothetical protein
MKHSNHSNYSNDMELVKSGSGDGRRHAHRVAQLLSPVGNFIVFFFFITLKPKVE